MKIIVADKISPHGVQLLVDAGWEVKQPGATALAAELADADALIVRSATRVTEELLAQAPRLRIVGRAGVGVDNIDLEAATHRGILVVNTPGSSATSVAEHALGVDAGAGALGAAIECGDARGALGKIGRGWRGVARENAGAGGAGARRRGSGAPRARRWRCACSRTILI